MTRCTSPAPLVPVLLISLCACGSKPAPTVTPPLACNGHPELCGRSYNAVAYAGTHDAYADTDENFLAHDQTVPIPRQLDDGIRVIHIEAHAYDGGVFACHSDCYLGQEPLIDEMQSVNAFLDSNPREVVTLLLERSDATITADDIGFAMRDAGLAPKMRTQSLGQPWPTLGELVDAGTRAVAFLDDPSGSNYPWLLPRWDFTWETPWDNETPQDFGRCDADRGTKGNSLYVVDTYLEDWPVQSAAHEALINYNPFLIDRLLDCQQKEQALPNFVMVDFYDVSDVFRVVDMLNGFVPAPRDISGFPPNVFVDGGAVVDVDAGPGDGG
ncbi:MAG: hypothetical protein JST54_22535 [Deltaproteobacteria bacterium]|nr:hypothetical protein [Deltaproteobacteria bacterium]